MTKARNYAHIVYRLLTDARGWRLDELKHDLALADRTWRKYRLELQRHFTPFHDEDGTSLLVEVDEDGARWVRLRSPPTLWFQSVSNHDDESSQE